MVKVALLIGALLGLSNTLRFEEHEIAVQTSHSIILFIFRSWSSISMSWRYNAIFF
jgi:hypothetical protein